MKIECDDFLCDDFWWETGSHAATRESKDSETHHAMNVFNATVLLSMVIIHELEMNESAVACVFILECC